MLNLMSTKFHENFLAHLLQLRTFKDVGLESICFAPMLGPFSGPKTIDSCTVQSILGLFNNDIYEFEYNNNYIDKMMTCAR